MKRVLDYYPRAERFGFENGRQDVIVYMLGCETVLLTLFSARNPSGRLETCNRRPFAFQPAWRSCSLVRLVFANGRESGFGVGRTPAVQ